MDIFSTNGLAQKEGRSEGKTASRQEEKGKGEKASGKMTRFDDDAVMCLARLPPLQRECGRMRRRMNRAQAKLRRMHEETHLSERNC